MAFLARPSCCGRPLFVFSGLPEKQHFPYACFIAWPAQRKLFRHDCVPEFAVPYTCRLTMIPCLLARLPLSSVATFFCATCLVLQGFVEKLYLKWSKGLFFYASQKAFFSPSMLWFACSAARSADVRYFSAGKLCLLAPAHRRPDRKYRRHLPLLEIMYYQEQYIELPLYISCFCTRSICQMENSPENGAFCRKCSAVRSISFNCLFCFHICLSFISLINPRFSSPANTTA